MADIQANAVPTELIGQGNRATLLTHVYFAINVIKSIPSAIDQFGSIVPLVVLVASLLFTMTLNYFIPGHYDAFDAIVMSSAVIILYIVVIPTVSYQFWMKRKDDLPEELRPYLQEHARRTLMLGRLLFIIPMFVVAPFLASLLHVTTDPIVKSLTPRPVSLLMNKIGL